MNVLFGSLVGIVFLVIVMNFFVLFLRMKRNTSPYGRKGKQAVQEDVAAVYRDNEVQRRIDLEQDRIAQYLEKREKTWALYEEVRRRHSGEFTS